MALLFPFHYILYIFYFFCQNAKADSRHTWPTHDPALVVQRADNFFQQISRYPADKMHWLEYINNWIVICSLNNQALVFTASPGFIAKGMLRYVSDGQLLTNRCFLCLKFNRNWGLFR